MAKLAIMYHNSSRTLGSLVGTLGHPYPPDVHVTIHTPASSKDGSKLPERRDSWSYNELTSL